MAKKSKKSIFDLGEPNFINDQGVKWWLDDTLTNHAKSVDKNYSVWIVEEKSGNKTWLLLDAQSILYENQNFEAMACKIDFLKLNKDFK